MKTMTCKQLAGACDLELRAETWDEMQHLSRQHGMEMAEKQDAAHLKAMDEMRALMSSPDAMQEMMERVKGEFDALPEDA